MQVLITGGTGFIGRALCTRLKNAGHGLTVLTRYPSRAGVPGVRYVDTLEQVDVADAVVNLAGEPLAEGRWSAARKQEFRDSRIGTTAHVVEWIGRQPRLPRVLVSGSALGYYGPRDDTPLDESAPAGDDFASQLCQDWEAEANRAVALGVRTCRVRTGLVLGRGGGALAKMLPPFRLGLGGRMGDGRQWMSWIHREDLVAMIEWLLENGQAQGAYNGTAPQPVRNADFARALGKALHRPAILPVPSVLLKAAFGEMSQLVLTGQKVLPKRAVAEGFVFRYPTLERALADLVGGSDAHGVP